MAEAEEQPCAEIIWRIENFTYCWQEKGEKLFSSSFSLECQAKTSWNLYLYPNGTISTDSLGFGLYLRRSYPGLRDEPVRIKYELSVLNSEYIPYVTRVCGDLDSFRHGSSYGWNDIISRSNIVKDAGKLYPKNVLTVRCKMWHERIEQPCCPTVVDLRTLIPVTQCSFEWNIDLAAVETSEQEKTITFPSLFGSDSDFLKFTLSYVTRYRDSRLLKIAVSGESKKEYSFKCDIRTAQTKDHFFLKLNKIDMLPYEKLFEPLLTRNQLNKISETHFMDYTLILTCKLSLISHEMKNDAIGSIEKSKDPSVWCPKIDGEYDILFPANSTNKMSGNCTSYTLKEDVLKLYQGGFRSDFTLQVESQTFPVHSCILSARSAVLDRMFETEMKEKQEKKLQIEDLDGNTVKKMLDYVYTDSAGELNIESAVKLYYAGDKYVLFGLKQICSEYMIQNMTIRNVYDVLMLAYQHNDEDLKSSAIQFMFKNEKDTVLSDQFKIFCKNHPQLGVEVMHNILERKINQCVI